MEGVGTPPGNQCESPTSAGTPRELDGEPAIADRPTEPRYIFRRESDVWYMQFGDEHATFPHSVNFEVYAKLLIEPGRQMDALELSSPGVRCRTRETINEDRTLGHRRI